MIKIYPNDIIKFIKFRSEFPHETQLQILVMYNTKVFGFTICKEKWSDVSDMPDVYDDYEYIKRRRESDQTEWQYEYPFNMEPRWEFKQ